VSTTGDRSSEVLYEHVTGQSTSEKPRATAPCDPQMNPTNTTHGRRILGTSKPRSPGSRLRGCFWRGVVTGRVTRGPSNEGQTLPELSLSSPVEQQSSDLSVRCLLSTARSQASKTNRQGQKSGWRPPCWGCLGTFLGASHTVARHPRKGLLCNKQVSVYTWHLGKNHEIKL
jgi:hypothetical protein